MCWLNREGGGFNDPNMWDAERRTQKECEVRIAKMRVDGTYKQTESGIRNEFKVRDNPLFLYFKGFKQQLDVFSHVMWDKMHDVYLGLLKECFQALALEYDTTKNDNVSKKKNLFNFALAFPAVARDLM